MMPIWQNKTDHLPIKQAMELISIACFIGCFVKLYGRKPFEQIKFLICSVDIIYYVVLHEADCLRFVCEYEGFSE